MENKFTSPLKYHGNMICIMCMMIAISALYAMVAPNAEGYNSQHHNPKFL